MELLLLIVVHEELVIVELSLVMRRLRWILSLLGGCLFFALPIAAQVDISGQQTSEVRGSKHDGGKNDIQAIGSRQIGKRGLGNWYSLEDEVAMGREYSKGIEAVSKEIDDPLVTEFVNRVGQNLVRNSDAKVPFTIRVIDSDEINAFALPGGFLYVNSGLILAAENEAELAGVMAHEIAHVAAHHATRQMTRKQLFTLASIPLIFVGGGVGLAVEDAVGLATPLSLIKFSRGFEAEADYLGVEYLYEAGYDPQAFVSFFERIQAEEKRKPRLIDRAFSSHPQTPDRIKKTQQEIAQILPGRETYIVSTSDFEEVRSHLVAQALRRSISQKGEAGPSLQRKTVDQNDSDEDQPPKLVRRP